MKNDIEQQARELLAAEYRKAGKTDWAEGIAGNDYAECEHYALLAIFAALASQAQEPAAAMPDAWADPANPDDVVSASKLDSLRNHYGVPGKKIAERYTKGLYAAQPQAAGVQVDCGGCAPPVLVDAQPQAEQQCNTCEPAGVFATDGTGPYDCYACGKKAEQHGAGYTTGHCENKRQPGGCHLHNLQCGWPKCDRRNVARQPAQAEQPEVWVSTDGPDAIWVFLNQATNVVGYSEVGPEHAREGERSVKYIRADLASQVQVPAVTVPEDVRRAGAMLSNCAYNLAQREHLTADERRSLDEARRAWDAAMIAARHAEWAATATAAAPAPEVR